MNFSGAESRGRIREYATGIGADRTIEIIANPGLGWRCRPLARYVKSVWPYRHEVNEMISS